MEQETIETTVVTETEGVKKGNSKVKIFGAIAAGVTVIALAFRKKIKASMRKRAINKLIKDGYTVEAPIIVDPKEIDEQQ